MGRSADLPSVACAAQVVPGSDRLRFAGDRPSGVRVLRAAETMVGPIDSATYTYVTSGGGQ